MKRDSVIIYRTFYEGMKGVPERSYKRIMNAILKYALDGEETQLEGMEYAVFCQTKLQIDKNNQKYENGCKRTKSESKQQASDGQSESERQPNYNQKETEIIPNNNQSESKQQPKRDINDNDNDICNLKKEEDKEEKKASSSAFANLETELNAFCEKFNVMVDNYNINITEIDFKLLTQRFEESSWLRANMTSFKRICEIYPKIISGYYKQYVNKLSDTKDTSYDKLRRMLEDAKAEEQGG